MENRSRTTRRMLRIEQLDSRYCMAADSILVFHNASLPEDVNGDSAVSVLDALIVINQLNRRSSESSANTTDSTYFTDVNDDGAVTPSDVLQIINTLNNRPVQSSTVATSSSVISTSVATAATSTSSIAVAKFSLIPAAELDKDVITTSDVTRLLDRAAMATSSNDAIIAIVDRSGRILGVRLEQDVLASYQNRLVDRVFAIDGAVAKARTAAFFSNSEAPLTSRTIRFISQSTITQREVESNPNIPDANSTSRGPGFVAPIGLGGNFPPQVANTPLVDLFAIEHQSRDSSRLPGLDGIKGTVDDLGPDGTIGGTDDLTLTQRFDVNSSFVPDAAQVFMETFPESYGAQSGLLPMAQSRGIATLPGGVPLYKNGRLVGGIGVFFPGPNGYATFEQGFVHTSVRGSTQLESERVNAPKVLESEFIAFFAAGGTVVGPGATSVDRFEGLAPPRGPFGGVSGRIDLVGITLEIYGPNPTRQNPVTGQQRLLQIGLANGGGKGLRNNGGDQIVNKDLSALDPNANSLRGRSVPEGWLVLPHSSSVDPITGDDVQRIVSQGIAEANKTRAAIRLTSSFLPGARTKMVLAVADSSGEVLGLYRMTDATIFSIDVAVAKARNTAYYASDRLLPQDMIDQNNDGVKDVPKNVAFTNRTFRFVAGPRYPTGVTGAAPGDFSMLNMPGINPATGENTVNTAPLAASVYASPSTATVLAFDSFNASRNFRDGQQLTGAALQKSLKRQNGIVFFPGSTPLYVNSNGTKKLVGGFGVSGDGVDQDDVVTSAGQVGFEAPTAIRADQYFAGGVRLPYQKFNRNPSG
ncbi:MAG: heme-binding protein [Planctomycetota bacterium]|nr:heme-binding protein [Planctomycetota bacterium]